MNWKCYLDKKKEGENLPCVICMHIIIVSKTSSRLSHINRRDPSDRVIQSIVPHKAGFLRRAKRPTAVRSTYIRVRFWRPLIVIKDLIDRRDRR